ncbi:hypothetical protein GCM10010124_06730 [Pilimelia terevasa]|uniref:Uncharacterized protein n=1 Tax=Pilimelia terevasa TaxID=53372 RepID=A0A8J3BL27_9ACTN|nr:hypothetical protein [Pilimelia terevasa]GGK16787.1 hypothetical protein GCM10010124_06730 [Pilimelia terevasa]
MSDPTAPPDPAADGARGAEDADPAGSDGEGGPAAPPGRWREPADRALRVAGVLVTVALAVLTGVLELVLVPLRIGGVPAFLCVVLAVVVNYRLPRFADLATGARWPALVGFGAWLLLMLAGAGRTSEGDVLVHGGVGIMVNIGGSLAFGVAMYRLMVSSDTRAGRPAPAAPDPA